MFSVFRQGRRVIFDYLVFLIIYIAFLPLVISIAKENIDRWIPAYSFVIGTLLLLVIWNDVYAFAKKEKKPVYKLNPSPHKGLLIGLVGIAPYVILTAVAFYVTHIIGPKYNFTVELTDVIRNAFPAPIYFVIAILGKGPAAYAAAAILVPLTCYLAYLMGNLGITKRGLVKSVKAAIEKHQKKEDTGNGSK